MEPLTPAFRPVSRFGVVIIDQGQVPESPPFAPNRKKRKRGIKVILAGLAYFFSITNLPYEHEIDSFFSLPFDLLPSIRVREQARFEDRICRLLPYPTSNSFSEIIPSIIVLISNADKISL